MKANQPKPAILRRFFAGLTENAFHARLGLADPPLTDYLTDMLVRFIRSDAIYRIRDVHGRKLAEVAEMMIEAELRVGIARRDVHRHIGDFILFWTGVYPDALCRLKGPQSKDQFLDYCSQGKRAYYIASTIASDNSDDADSEVLGRLSNQFEICIQGLTEGRREWERNEGGGQVPLLI